MPVCVYAAKISSLLFHTKHLLAGHRSASSCEELMSVDVKWVTLQRAGELPWTDGTQEKVGLSEALGQGECCRSGDSFPGTGGAWSLWDPVLHQDFSRLGRGDKCALIPQRWPWKPRGATAPSPRTTVNMVSPGDP